MPNTIRPQSDTKPQSAGHTAEPWAVCGYGGPNASPDEYAVWAASATVAHIYPRSETSDPSATQAANARRIVACVNACAGLTEQELGRFIDVADALRERVRSLEESLGDACVFLLQAAEQGTLDAGEVGTLVAAYRAAITEFTAGARRQS